MLSNISVIVKLTILIDCLLCFRGSSVRIWAVIQSRIMSRVPRVDQVFYFTLFTIKKLLCLAYGNMLILQIILLNRFRLMMF